MHKEDMGGFPLEHSLMNFKESFTVFMKKRRIVIFWLLVLVIGVFLTHYNSMALELDFGETKLMVCSPTTGEGILHSHHIIIDEDPVTITKVSLVNAHNIYLIETFITPPRRDGGLHVGSDISWPPKNNQYALQVWDKRIEVEGAELSPKNGYILLFGVELDTKSNHGFAEDIRVDYLVRGKTKWGTLGYEVHVVRHPITCTDIGPP